jgi:hypothetical protein
LNKPPATLGELAVIEKNLSDLDVLEVFSPPRLAPGVFGTTRTMEQSPLATNKNKSVDVWEFTEPIVR